VYSSATPVPAAGVAVIFAAASDSGRVGATAPRKDDGREKIK
jgi:hypothetical protein